MMCNYLESFRKTSHRRNRRNGWIYNFQGFMLYFWMHSVVLSLPLLQLLEQSGGPDVRAVEVQKDSNQHPPTHTQQISRIYLVLMFQHELSSPMPGCTQEIPCRQWSAAGHCSDPAKVNDLKLDLCPALNIPFFCLAFLLEFITCIFILLRFFRVWTLFAVNTSAVVSKAKLHWSCPPGSV